MAKVFILPPKKCSVCNRPLEMVFYDTTVPGARNTWAYLCPGCNAIYGVTHGDDNLLGTGIGQKYEKQPNGEWHKVR